MDACTTGVPTVAQQPFLTPRQPLTPMQVVWLKRDLRLADHAALQSALEACEDHHGVLLLYVAEPERRQQPDVSDLHLAWDLANARDLLDRVTSMGGTMRIEVGTPSEVLNRLHQEHTVSGLHSHEETGLMWSWERDKGVRAWCHTNGVPWTEHASNGVVRRLHNRDRWNGLRNRRMSVACLPTPSKLPAQPNLASVDESLNWVPSYTELVNTPLEAGEQAAQAWLTSFLDTRHIDYLPTISNPATSPQGSSRLSAYIASGVLSVRQVVQSINHARRTPEDERGTPKTVFNKNVNAFASRVSWRCHFVQRLEVEPTMESVSINPELCKALDRIDDEARYTAWSEGRTGWPFFDACMRSLMATGWINFRMRAMLQSVAAYTLWLPWQRTGSHLARLFIDYEPGIHWSQIHMQSGVTGINSVRAYSVLKQSLDHDMDGSFIRRWVPELAMVPTPYIHEPWTMSDEMQSTVGVNIGTTYPSPIVDEAEERGNGIAAAYAAKRGDTVKARSAKVYTKHGSRKQRGRRPPSTRKAAKKPSAGTPETKEQKLNQTPEKKPQLTLLDFEG